MRKTNKRNYSENLTLERALFRAVQRGDDRAVSELIDAVDNVNITDNEGKTALFYAVQLHVNDSVVRALINAGADVNITDNKGKTALFYAVQKRWNDTAVCALIDAGTDVDITDNRGKTALFYAVQLHDNDNVVHALIHTGADLNVRDLYNRTPLIYSMLTSSFLPIFLIEKGASFDLKDNNNALTFLIEKFYSVPDNQLRDKFQMLVQGKIVNKKQIFEAIISVVFTKILSFNQSLCGVDVNSLLLLLQLATDYTSMVDIKKRNSIKKLLRTIKERKPLVTFIDKHQTRLMINHERINTILLQLVELGANPNSVDLDGNTALHHAVQLPRHGGPEGTLLYICKQLLELGASLHVKNVKKETPLLSCLITTIINVSTPGWQQWSQVHTSLAVCQFLVEQGSNMEEKAERGQTALHLILELLRRALLDEKLKAISLGEIIRLKKILNAFQEKALPTAIKDDSGNTPLHVWAALELPSNKDYVSAIADGYTFQRLLKMVLDHLIHKSKQLHAKNKNGETPLHLCRTWTAVELLLDAGANPSDVDSSGRSPLLVAAQSKKVSECSLYPDILLALDQFWRKVINKGLDPWTADIHDETVLSKCMECQSHDLARALVDVACDDIKVRSRPLVLFSVLKALCKDKSPNAQWKKDAAEKMLKSTQCPVNGNEKEHSPLHYCCRNIVQLEDSSSADYIKSTVHWRMVELLRSFGADYRIPDATDKSCLEIAEDFPALKDLLMKPIDIDKFPVRIKHWKSVSKSHGRSLAKVARHLESNHIEPFWYHKDPLACGSFGAVYAGINERDGREVAIKRILKVSMQRPQDQREITNLTALADCDQIVRYLSFFGDEVFSYIVLELMEGNLDDLLNASITLKGREELCMDVVKGLSYMHTQRYLHRDLKPANILFKTFPKRCLKIADFGLSRLNESTQNTTVYGTNAGTRCWIAPEVLTATKDQHSTASDMFSCGLVLHYILTVKKHPFSPKDCANKGEFQIRAETETNIMNDNKEGWDDSLSPEASNLLKQLLNKDAKERPTAEKSLTHPLFWAKAKKIAVLIAVGNQPEFECPRSKRTPPLSAVETDMETRFGTIVKYVDWNDRRYVKLPVIYTEMTKKRKRYDTHSVVELVRFIRNAYAHVSESTRPTPMRKQLLEDFVFLEYFPNLVMEVYKAVTTHGWDRTREEIKYAMKKY